MAIIDNLVSYWKLDEASGDAIDAHGDNDGTTTGVTYSDTGIINTGLGFGGDGDRITISDVAELRPGTGAWSISLWFKAADASQASVLYGKWNTNDPYNQYIIWIGSPTSGWSVDSSKRMGYVEIDAYPTQAQFWRSDDDVVDGNYHHIVWTRDTSGNITLYVDGDSADITQTLDKGTPPYDIDNTEDVTIGALNSAASPFTGQVDEIGVWNRELTSGEVTALYNSGDGFAYPFTEEEPTIGITAIMTTNTKFWGS